MLIETLDALKNGTLCPEKQDDSLSSYASQLSKAEGEINWNENNLAVYNKVRGLNPWPMSYSFIGKKRFVVEFVYMAQGNGIPGEVLRADDSGIEVACKEGSVIIKEIKPEGKKKMSVSDFLRGHKIEKGFVLGKDE